MNNNISFIVPAYNAEKYLEDCICSILKILLPDDEILIINDGSSDNTLEIANSLALKNAQITIINQENRGVSVARNRGILEAKKDYIMFVDADDLLSDSFKYIERAFDGADIVYYAKELENNVNKDELLLNLACIRAPHIAGPFSKVFNRSFLIDNSIKFPDSVINGEDMLFNITALLLAEKYRIIKKSYYNYRIVKGTATKRFDREIIESDKRFHEVMDQICGKYDKHHKKTLGHIKETSRSYAIITILSRISYIEHYKEARPFFEFLEDNPYGTALTKPQSLKQKMIFRLCRKKRYFALYILFRLKRKTNKKEYFKEI